MLFAAFRDIIAEGTYVYAADGALIVIDGLRRWFVAAFQGSILRNVAQQQVFLLVNGVLASQALVHFCRLVAAALAATSSAAGLLWLSRCAYWLARYTHTVIV